MQTRLPDKINPLVTPQLVESLKQIQEAQRAYEIAQEGLQEALSQIELVTQSSLSDLSLLPQLYVWYCDVAQRNQFSGDMRNANHKQFVFVALMLYAPMSLCGGKIHRGLRMAIASLLNLRSHTILYHMRDKAVAWNKTYKPFAAEVEVAYEQVMRQLPDRWTEGSTTVSEE